MKLQCSLPQTGVLVNWWLMGSSALMYWYGCFVLSQKITLGERTITTAVYSDDVVLKIILFVLTPGVRCIVVFQGFFHCYSGIVGQCLERLILCASWTRAELSMGWLGNHTRREKIPTTLLCTVSHLRIPHTTYTYTCTQYYHKCTSLSSYVVASLTTTLGKSFAEQAFATSFQPPPLPPVYTTVPLSLEKCGCTTYCFSLLVCGWKLLVFYWWWNCFPPSPNIQLENPVLMGRVLTSYMCIYMCMYIVQQLGHTSTMNAILSRGLPTLSVQSVYNAYTCTCTVFHSQTSKYRYVYTSTVTLECRIHFVCVFSVCTLVVCWVRVSFLSSLPLWLP